jgi:hypothetical protein
MGSRTLTNHFTKAQDGRPKNSEIGSLSVFEADLPKWGGGLGRRFPLEET